MTASNVLAVSDKGVRRAMTGCFMKLRIRNILHDITRPERVARVIELNNFPTLAEHIRGNRKKLMNY